MTNATAERAISSILRNMGALDDCHQELLNSGCDIRLDTLKLDSVSVFNFCMALEDAIGREISLGELIDNPTIHSLSKHLSEEL